MELTGIQRLAFCVADDPFFKSERSKYFPEVFLINKKSKIQALVSPAGKQSKNYGAAFDYLENFREPALKVNDDKKVRISLSDLCKKGDATKGKMILLTVRCTDMRKAPPKAGEFDRSWYRVVNEDTNQTIDYSNIKKIEKPEGFDEDAPVNAEEGEAPPPRVEITYVAGRIFYDESSGRWVYESLNHVFTSDKYPNLVDKLAEIYRTGEQDLQF